MKAKTLIIVLAAFLAFSACTPAEAVAATTSQRHPNWAPEQGYRHETRHIYFPDYNFYYDNQRSVYIFFNNGKWRVNSNLPVIYSRINLRNASQVELVLNSNYPQRYNGQHKEKYKSKKYKRGHNNSYYEHKQIKKNRKEKNRR